MEYPNTSSSKDEPSDLGTYSPVLPKELWDKIFKYLNNVQDLAQGRRVCRIWYEVATPLYVKKIDQIEINFFLSDRKEATYRRALADKYREKQRRVPNKKLSQTDIDEVYRETTGDISIDDDLEGTSFLISKYCDYIESGGTIKYTNFNFTGVNFYKNETVSRFFSLCGKHVTILTVSDHGDYSYCDQPDVLCSKCLDPKLQNTKSVLSSFLFRTLINTYCPNLNILTLSKALKNDGVDDTDFLSSDESNEAESDEGVEEMLYMMELGDISKSDKAWKLAKEIPPFNNIHTVRVIDQLVADLCNTMFIYQLFALCPRITSASNYGKKKNAFESRTFDFVRAIVTNADNISELFLHNLDAGIINTLLHRHKNRLHLKFLKVNYLATHLAESNFLRFLESQSNTLETIMCGLTQNENQLWIFETIRFPKEMPKLFHLRIGLGKQEQSDCCTRPPKAVAPINWAKQFPSLQTLMLPEFATNVTIASFFEYPDPVEPLTTVTGLELPARLATNLMTRAGFLFPNVTQLAVGYQTFESLRQIWTLWPKLKSLHISVVDFSEQCPIESDMESISLDELLTGFDKKQIKIAKNGNRCVIGDPKFPSITNLQDLRELTIHAAPYRTHSGGSWRVNLKNVNDFAVSDISVIHALMKLSSLKYLDISHHLYNISPAADEEFCNYMGLFHEGNVTTRKNFCVMSHYRGREEAHPMCSKDTMYKDK